LSIPSGHLKIAKRVGLLDINNAPLRTSRTVTLLWVQMGAQVVRVTFLVVEALPAPGILGCTLIDDNAHAILSQDRSIRRADALVTAILRGSLDDGVRSMGVSCDLCTPHETRLLTSAATFVWVRTMWGGLGHVFGAACLFKTQRVTIATGAPAIMPGLSFLVIVTN